MTVDVRRVVIGGAVAADVSVPPLVSNDRDYVESASGVQFCSAQRTTPQERPGLPQLRASEPFHSPIQSAVFCVDLTPSWGSIGGQERPGSDIGSPGKSRTRPCATRCAGPSQWSSSGSSDEREERGTTNRAAVVPPLTLAIHTRRCFGREMTDDPSPTSEENANARSGSPSEQLIPRAESQDHLNTP